MTLIVVTVMFFERDRAKAERLAERLREDVDDEMMVEVHTVVVPDEGGST
jgi:hypothetical protein